MREDGDKAGIVRRLSGEVSLVLLTGKKGRLVGPRPAIRLDPSPVRVAGWDQCASPKSNLILTKKRVGHFYHDAAGIFVCEEIPACKLKVVERAEHVEEERIAAPTGKEQMVTSPRHMRLASFRDLHSLNDNLPVGT